MAASSNGQWQSMMVASGSGGKQWQTVATNDGRKWQPMATNDGREWWTTAALVVAIGGRQWGTVGNSGGQLTRLMEKERIGKK